jgi:hypothetical protein
MCEGTGVLAQSLKTTRLRQKSQNLGFALIEEAFKMVN